MLCSGSLWKKVCGGLVGGAGRVRLLDLDPSSGVVSARIPMSSAVALHFALPSKRRRALRCVLSSFGFEPFFSHLMDETKRGLKFRETYVPFRI